MNKNILVSGVALALGLGIGFGVGKSGAGGSDAEANGVAGEGRTRGSNRSEMGGNMDSSGRKKSVRSVDEIYRRPGQSGRVQGLLDFYGSLSPDQFASEAEKLDSLPFNERILAAVLLFGKWSETDPTAAMAYTDTMGMAGAFVRPTVLQGWAGTDPVNAAKYYTSNPAQFAMMNMMGGGRGRFGGQGPGGIIAGEWAKQDPEAAMNWASSLTTKSDDAMSSVVSEVAKDDPAKAAAMASEMEPDARRDANDTIGRRWGAANFAEAEAWANGLPEDQRGRALASAIEGLAQTSPELAAAEIGKMSDKEAMRDAVPSVAKSYAREDVKGSMDWLASLDDDEAKSDSMRDVMPIWAAADSAAALDFVKSQTSAEVKDSAAETYVFSNRTSSPAELVEVAALIEDEGDRNRATGVVAARWMQEDKAAATEFINNSESFSDDMKERLLDGRGPWGGRGRGR